MIVSALLLALSAPSASAQRVGDDGDRTRAELAEDGRRIMNERRAQREEEERRQRDDEERKLREYQKDPIRFSRCMAANTPSGARGVCY